MELITPNAGTIFWMVIIFGVVAFILKKFAWKPILGALDEREDSIENALEQARKAREEVSEMKAKNEKMMAEARKEKEAILHEAMKLKENIIAEAKEKAAAETRRNFDQARQQIENEKSKAISEMKRQMTEVSLMIAEKVIRKEMADNKQQQEMVRRLVDEIDLN